MADGELKSSPAKLAAQRKYRAANREAINARQRARREDPSTKEKQRQAVQNWRKNNPGYLGPTRQALVDYVDSVKQHPCMDCGGTFPTECMDLDHVQGDKVDSVSRLISLSRPMEEIQAEVAKCELVCANCHRIRTRKRYFENDDIHKWETK